MADFGNTSIKPLETAVTPQNPVVDDSAVIAAQGQARAIESAGQGIARGFQLLGGALQTHRRNAAASASGAILGKFTSELGRIDQAVQQGSINSQQAATMKRNLVGQTMANNPSMADDVRQTYTSLSGKEGFGAPTPEQKARDDLRENAFKDGFINDTMTDDQKAEGLANYSTIKKEQAEMADATARLNLKRDQLGVESAEMKYEQQKQSRQLQVSLPKIGEAFFNQTKLGIDQLMSDLQASANDPQLQARTVQELNQMKAEFNNSLAQMGAGVDEQTRGSIKAISAPIELMLDDAIEMANGNITAEVYANAVKNNQNRALLMIGSDPRVWRTIAISEFAPKIAQVAATAMGSDFIEMIVDPSGAQVTAPTNPNKKAYYDGMQTFNQSINNGSLAKGPQASAETEFNTRNNGILKSIHNNDTAYEAGPQLNLDVDYLSSETFRNFVKGGNMDQELATKALTTVQRHYQSDLMPKIEQMLSQDPAELLGQQALTAAVSAAAGAGELGSFNPSDLSSLGPVKDMVEISWEGGAVFKPVGDDPLHAQAAQLLNRDVAPLLTRSTRAITHLQGGEKYDQVFTNDILPSIGLGQEEGEGPRGFSEPPAAAVNEAAAATSTRQVETTSESAVEGPEIGTVEPLEGVLQLPQPEATEASPEASQGQAAMSKPQVMSNDDIVKAARESAVAQGYDPESTAGWAYASKEYLRMKKEKQQVGTQVSKAAVAHTNSPTTKAAMSIPQTEVVNYLKGGMVDRGLPPHVAEAFIMNFQDESGLNPGINEKAPIVKGSRGGYGLYQLTGPRRRQYEAYAKATGRPLDSIDAQLDFLMMELEGSESKAADRILSATTRGEAAEAIVRYFLRPLKKHQDSRAARYRKLG